MSVSSAERHLDPLDSDNYDPIEHLNAIFSHPSTLSSVHETYEVLQTYQDGLDDEIDMLEIEQEQATAQCLERMQASKGELAELFTRIENVRERAIQTERNITEMTADIKQLDNTKKNLTLSMTALKRLQMLTTAHEQLRGLFKTKQYRECAQLLQAVIQLMAYFKSYRSIDQIAILSRNVAELQRELLEQVCEDFEITFTKEEVLQRRGMLHEACLVVDALGDAAKSRLITWYCNTELRQYRHIFKGDQEAGSLDNIDRRYAWFRKTLKVYDEEHAAIFPPRWKVNEVLANVFADGTRDDYKGILSRATRGGHMLDVKLLLSCLQQTLDFEQSLERRFHDTSRTSMDTTSSNTEHQGFASSISVAFEPYLSLWVDAQERELSRLIPQYRSRPARPPDEDFSPQQVISSSTELFNFYRLSLAQCAKLSTAQPLLRLSQVFGRFLEQYAQQVLLTYVAEKPTSGTPSRIPMVEDLVVVLNTADYCYTTSTQLEEKIKSRIDEQFKDKVDLSNQADTFMGIASATVRSLVRRVEVDLEPTWREMRNIAWARIETAENYSSYIPSFRQRVRDRSGPLLEMLHKQQYARAFADNLVELLTGTFLTNVPNCKPISEAGAEQLLLDSYEIRTTLSQIMPGNPPPALFLKRVNASISRIEPLLKTLQVRPAPPEALVQAYLIHIADLSEANFRKILELKGIRTKSEQNQLIELFQMHKLSPRYKDSLVEKSPLLTPLMTNVGGHTSSTSTGGSGITSNPLSNLSSAIGNSAAVTSLSTANLPANMKFDATGLGSAIMDRFSSASTNVSASNTPQINVIGSTPAGTGAPIRDGAISPQPLPGNATGPSNLSLNMTSSSSQQNNSTNNGTSTTSANPSPLLSAAGIGISGLSLSVPDTDSAAKLNENLKNIGKFFRRDLGAFGSRFGSGGNNSASTTPTASASAANLLSGNNANGNRSS